MNCFLAVNDRQLGTCLRMLFAEKLQPAVQTVLNEKGKIEFHISIAADQEVFEELNECSLVWLMIELSISAWSTLREVTLRRTSMKICTNTCTSLMKN